jgi:hypothetical protein
MISWLNNQKIGAKLAIPLAVVALSSGAIVWNARDGIHQLNEAANDIVSGYAFRSA